MAEAKGRKVEIEDSIEAMKALRREKLDELRQAYVEKKAEVKVLHYSPESELGRKLEDAQKTGEAVKRGGLRVVPKREKE